MRMTREDELEELNSLKECVEDIGLTAEVVQQAGKEQHPALAVTLPEEDFGKKCTLVCCFLPLKEDQSQFVKYLQMYIEREEPLPDAQMPIALLLINQINQILVVQMVLSVLCMALQRVYAAICVYMI